MSTLYDRLCIVLVGIGSVLGMKYGLFVLITGAA